MKIIITLILFCMLTFHVSPIIAQELAGNWQFVASNNGIEVAPGIYSSGTDTFSFTATANADGQSLDCHSDCLYKSVGNNEYAANWRIVIEKNTEGQHRLGWVLTKDTPAFVQEFNEPSTNYLEKGWWYHGTGSEEHHYIYLLSENADATSYVATTFWSAWSDNSTTEYSLSSSEYNSQKIYAFVANGIPYANPIGVIEIWASPKIKKTNSDPAGIHEVASEKISDDSYYDLQGRRLNGQPAKGLYIRNGKKYYVK